MKELALRLLIALTSEDNPANREKIIYQSREDNIPKETVKEPK